MPLTQRLPRIAWAILLDQVLDGMRQGGVPPWPPRRWPILKRRLEQGWLGPIWGTSGDKLANHERWPTAAHLMLNWSGGLVRPDHQVSLGLAQIAETAWVEQTAWRPLLAVAATSGLLPIPNFPRHYRPSPRDSALDVLCGLWAVGASTTYRYVDRGRRMLVDALCTAQSNSNLRWMLRELAASSIGQTSVEWHRAQAKAQAEYGHAMDAAWHLYSAERWHELAELLRHRALEFASSPEHLALSRVLRRASLCTRDRICLSLGESAMWRCLGDSQEELNCLLLALRTAEFAREDAAQVLYIGQALYGLGLYYNAREPEQSIGHLEVAAQKFLEAARYAPDVDQHLVQSGYVSTLALLAFLHLRRKSPQAQALLRSARSAAAECDNLDIDAQGMLLKAQAEESRCQDQLDLAIQYRQQALVLYERAANQMEVVESHSNLGQLMAQLGRSNEAQKYCERVVEVSRKYCVRPETLLCAYGGLAVAAMTRMDFDLALHYLAKTLTNCQKLGLQRHEVTTLDNLSEAHTLRFKQYGEPTDELLASQFAEQAKVLSESLGLGPTTSVTQRTLSASTATHHLLPIETSAHPGEFAKIETLRAELALPRPPAQRARTHIALSQLYLRIAAKERDAARGLMQTHGLSELEGDIEALQQTWAHDGNLASQLSSRWREQVGDWLTDSQRKAVLERLLAEGSLSKSSYGEAAEVSPATASKHLGLLADKGLLEQQGRGPATRYVLPGEASSGSPSSPKVH